MFRGLHLFGFLTAFSVLVWLTPSSSAADPLPNTKPLTEDGDLAAKMVAGMHKYLDRELAAAAKNRAVMQRKGKGPARESLKQMLGLVDARLAPRMEYISGPAEPAVRARHLLVR